MKSTTTREQTQQTDRPSKNEARERAPFEAPHIERRGQLPKVTTAFGGTFNP